MNKEINSIIDKYSFIDFFELHDFNIKGEIIYPFIRVQVDNLEFQALLAADDLTWSVSPKESIESIQDESEMYSVLFENNLKESEIDNLFNKLNTLFKKEPNLFKEGIIYVRENK